MLSRIEPSKAISISNQTRLAVYFDKIKAPIQNSNQKLCLGLLTFILFDLEKGSINFGNELLAQKIISKEEKIHKNKTIAFLCHNGENPIGFAILKRQVFYLKVAYLGFLQEYRGLGYGTELMKRIFQIAKKEKLLVTLEYDGTNWNTYKFYSKFNPAIQDKTRITTWFVKARYTTPIFDPKISLQAIMELRLGLIPSNNFNSKIWLYKNIAQTSQSLIDNAVKVACLVIVLLIFTVASVQNQKS